MKRWLLLFSFLIALPVYSNVILTDFSGNIKYRKNSLSPWEDVIEKELKLNDGYAIKTDLNSKAKIIAHNSVIWIGENTALEIEGTSKYLTSFGLVYGKIKGMVSGISKNSTFQIKTVSSLFKIKAATFVLKSNIEGKTEANILYGEVEFNYLIMPKQGNKKYIIVQGTGFKLENIDKGYDVFLLSEEDETEIMANWDPSITQTEVYREIKDEKIRRQRLKNFITYTNKINSEIKSFIYKEKESDFIEGRTLKDVNGNIVRVDQRLIRADSKTLQLFNIVKRQDRMDYFISTFNFNKDIPKNINNWQSFFNEPSVIPNWATFVSGNLLSNNQTFFMAEGYKYIQSRGELINNTEVVGVNQDTNEKDNDIIITGVIDKSNLSDIINLNIKEKDTNAPTGEILRKSGENIGNVIWGLKKENIILNQGTDLMHQKKATKYLKGGKEDEIFWGVWDNYLISNSGDIMKKDKFINSGKSLSEVVKENGIQNIGYLKKDNSGNISEENYFNEVKNIDIILIFDLPFYMYEKISSGVNRWKD